MCVCVCKLTPRVSFIIMLRSSIPNLKLRQTQQVLQVLNDCDKQITMKKKLTALVTDTVTRW